MSIPPASKARLLRELSLLTKDPPPGVAAYAPDPADMTRIRAQITGPEGSPFESGTFLVTVHVTARYPFEPPRCRFRTPLYHPNVDSGGRICLDTLKSPPAGSWSPAVSLPSLLLSVRSLMAEPNPDDGLVPDISELYKRDPARWREEARRRTESDATPEKLEMVEMALDGDDAQVGEVAAAVATERTARRGDGGGASDAGGNDDECNANATALKTTAEDSEEGGDPKRSGKDSTKDETGRALEASESVENGRKPKRSKLSSRK